MTRRLALECHACGASTPEGEPAFIYRVSCDRCEEDCPADTPRIMLTMIDKNERKVQRFDLCERCYERLTDWLK